MARAIHRACHPSPVWLLGADLVAALPQNAALRELFFPDAEAGCPEVGISASRNEKNAMKSLRKPRFHPGMSFAFRRDREIFPWEGKPMLSRISVRNRLGVTAAAFSLLLLPGSALATSLNVGWATDNSVGTLVNQAQLNIRVACSGNNTFCSGAGLMSAYQSNTATSQLTGTAASVADDVLATLSFDSFTANGTSILFTGIPTPIQPGGIGSVSNIVLASVNSVVSALTGYTVDQTDAQSIAVSFSGMDWAVSANTNVSAIGALALQSGPIVNATGTFVEVGTNAAPQFELRDLRGAFQLLTGTTISGANIAITFRATFTLNLKGIAAAIPEPGTFALLGGGLLLFGAAAARRRS